MSPGTPRQDAAASEPTKKQLGIGRVTARILVGTLAAVSLLVIAGAWMVASGPLSIPALTNYVEDALVFDDLGVRVRLGDADFVWGGWRRSLDVRAVGVRFVDDEGLAVASAPEVALSLSVPALVRGEFAPLRVGLYRPEFRVVRAIDGRFSFAGFEGGGEEAGAVFQVLMAALAALPGENRLDTVTITDGVLTFEDHATSTSFQASEVNAGVRRTAGGLASDIDMRIALDGDIVHVGVAAEYSTATGALTLGAAVSRLNPSHLAGVVAEHADRLRGLDVPVSGTVTAVIERGGFVTEVDYDLTSEAGVLDIPEIWHRPQPFERISARGSWNPKTSTLRLDDGFAESGTARGSAAGSLTLDTYKGVGLSLDATWRDVPLEDLSETWPWQLAPNVRRWVTARVHAGTVSEGALRMRVPPGGFRDLRLERDELDVRYFFEAVVATFHDDQPDLRDAHGTAQLTGADFDLIVERGTIGDLEISDGTLHIDGVNAQSQSAVIEVAAAGGAAEFVRLAALPPWSLDGLAGENLAGTAAVRAHFAMPVEEDLGVDNVRYAVAANVRDFGVGPLSGGLRVSDGAYSLRLDTNVVEAQGVINVNGAPMRFDARHELQGGEVPTRVTLDGILAAEQLGAFGLDTAGLTGALPFTADIAANGWTPAEIDLSVDMSAVQLSLPLEGWSKAAGTPGAAQVRLLYRDGAVHEVAEASLTTDALQVTARGVLDLVRGRAEGNATINGIDVDVGWQAASESGSGSRITLAASLDDAARELLGYPTGEWITGPLDATAVLETAGLEIGAAELSFDLAAAAIQFPGWRKEPSMDAVLRASVLPLPGGRLAVRSFAVSADGLVASGSVDWAEEGAFRSLRIARLILGDTSLSGTVRREVGDGPIRIEVAGPRLDAVHLFDELELGIGDDSPWSMDFTGRFDEVLLWEGRKVLTAEIGASRRGNAWDMVHASTKLPRGGDADASIQRVGEEYRIIATSTDAGDLFRVLGAFGGADGGDMELRAVAHGPVGARSIDGTIEVGAFRVAKAPALTQILSLASLTGLANVLQGQGLTFDGFRTPFTYADGKASLRDGRAWGPALGISVEGDFRPGDDMLNLAGTLVPAYTINRVLEAIPLLGEILVGEGIFAVAYRVTSEDGEPRVTVNPLSTLTPGFLREVIFGLPDEPPPGPDAAPPPGS